jgi:hypothetical protein
MVTAYIYGPSVGSLLVVDEGDHEYEVKYNEGLPVEHLHVEGVVQEVEPETE